VEILRPPVSKDMQDNIVRDKTDKPIEINPIPEVEEVFKNVPPKMAKMIDVAKVRVVDDLGGEGGRYDPTTKTIYIEKGEPVNEAVAHETAHNIIDSIGSGDKEFVSKYISERFKDRPVTVTDNFLNALNEATGDVIVRGLGGFVNSVEEAMASDIGQYVLDPSKLAPGMKAILDEFFGAGKEMLPAETSPAVKKTPKFKKPTHTSLITAQNRYAELLGVKPLVEPLERAKMSFDKERWTVANEVKKAVKNLEELKTVTPEQMAVLLNTNVDAPADLGDVCIIISFKIFNELFCVIHDSIRKIPYSGYIRENKRGS